MLISAFNLARLRRGLTPAPLFINIIVDILVAIFAIVPGASGLSGMGDSYCYIHYWDEPDEREIGRCLRRALPARIFAGIALGSAVIFG